MTFKKFDKIKVTGGVIPNYGVITEFVTIKGVEKVIFTFSSNGFVGEATLNNIEKIKSLVTPGRHLTKLLRHAPEDLKMDKHGYVEVSAILKKLDLTGPELKVIVNLDNKERFAFSDDLEKIRATQGHSIVGLIPKMTKVEDSSLFLYHGTSKENWEKIKESGFLKAMSRNYVHLSPDLETAEKVGLRHSKNKKDLIIFLIKSEDLLNNGINLFVSDNGVYQTNDIPVKLINITR